VPQVDGPDPPAFAADLHHAGHGSGPRAIRRGGEGGGEGREAVADGGRAGRRGGVIHLDHLDHLNHLDTKWYYRKHARSRDK